MNLRRPNEADFDGVLALLQAADIALLGESDWTASELRDEWEEADLDQNAWLLELGGKLAGYALLSNREGGRLNADGYVHPELRGRGVGSELLRLTEGRARELAAGIGGRVVLQNATLTGDPCIPALYDHPREARALHDTIQEAFAREWGFRAESFGEFEERRLAGKHFDPELWFVARTEDGLVGAIVCDWKRMGDWGGDRVPGGAQ